MTRLLLALLALMLTLSACGDEAVNFVGQDVVAGIPWILPEEARYRLLDGDEVKGSAVLRIELGEAGGVTFRQAFQGGEFKDEVVAEAAEETMRPASVQRVIEGPEGARRWEVTYSGSRALVVQRSKDDERTDELSVPTHSYDSSSDVFLWRTIDFSVGYEATYVDVLTATLAKPQIVSVTLRVKAKETVEVPAGSYEAWRVEIRSSGRTQKAWYADDGRHTLVRYDNGDLVFELLSVS